MVSENGSRLDTFPSWAQAWEAAPAFAAEVVRLGLAKRCGISVERRRLPGQSRTGRTRRTYDIVLSRYDGRKPVREVRAMREAMNGSLSA